MLAAGCWSDTPTYKRKDIARSIEKLCKEEYNIKVLVKESPNTVWVYYPISKILKSDFYKSEKPFDEDFVNRLRSIISSIGRVLLSADKTPDFYVLIATDIKNGFDYSITGYILDLKKFYAGYLPQPEFDKRYVINLNMSEESIGDTTGQHLKIIDMSFPDFLTQQIGQRISYFLYDTFKIKFKSLKGNFKNDIFRFEYEPSQKPTGNINLTDESLKIISFVLRDYEFKDFLLVEIEDKLTGELRSLGKHALFKEFR